MRSDRSRNLPGSTLGDARAGGLVLGKQNFNLVINGSGDILETLHALIAA